MTNFQKTAVVATLVLAGTSIYEARQASTLRMKARSLRQQLAGAATESTSATSGAPGKPSSATMPAASAKPRAGQPSVAVAPGSAQPWTSPLLALNTNKWDMAYSIGTALARVDPDEGLAALRANWDSITNANARMHLVHAFELAEHKWLPAAIDLALHDAAPEVQKCGLEDLPTIALQDFGTNTAAGLEWLATRRDSSLAEAFADGLSHAVEVLRGSDVDQIRKQLGVFLGNGYSMVRMSNQFPEVLASSGLAQELDKLASGADAQTAQLASQEASYLQKFRQDNAPSVSEAPRSTPP